MIRWPILFFALVLSACTSAPTRVKIETVPEGATVSSRASDGTAKIIGKTPIEVPAIELSGSGRLARILISKEGFEDHGVMLGRDMSSENYDINVKLLPKTENLKTNDSVEKQEQLAKRILKAYSLINGKRYDEARALLNDFIRDYPYISAGYDLMGNLFYKLRELKSAREYYERSLSINPFNQETKSMLSRLQGMQQ